MAARKLSRREFLQLAGISTAAVGLGVVIASRPGASFAPARSKVEIRLAAADEEVSPALVERFNQEFAPYHVTRAALDLRALPAALAGGKAPHAAVIPAPRAAWLGGQGVLADLSRFFAASQAARATTLFPVDDCFISGEQRWGLALAWSPDYLVWANRPLWQQAGVELPAGRLTLKEWRDISTRLGGTRGWGLGTDLTIDLRALLALAQTLDPAPDLFGGENGLNLRGSAAFVELVQFVLDWKKEGGIPFRRSLDPLKAYLPDCT